MTSMQTYNSNHGKHIQAQRAEMIKKVCGFESWCNLDDCMEKTDSKDHLPPLTSQSVVFKETVGDLREGPSHVGS